jgi:hypothetical protein
MSLRDVVLKADELMVAHDDEQIIDGEAIDVPVIHNDKQITDLKQPELLSFGTGDPDVVESLSTLVNFLSECTHEGVLVSNNDHTLHVETQNQIQSKTNNHAAKEAASVLHTHLTDGSMVMLDSGSDCHLLSHDTARKLLTNQRPSSFQVVGISQLPSTVDLEGELSISVRDTHGVSTAPAGAS